MKMLIVCPCGTKLRVLMAQYLKMRCPKCERMLALEIERQAARNSKIVVEMTALLLHERMTAQRWTHMDEKMARVLAQHEIESHGGVWPPPQLIEEAHVPFVFSVPDNPSVVNGPVPKETPTTTTRSIKVKTKKTKKGRR
jgi:hypothetical protein